MQGNMQSDRVKWHRLLSLVAYGGSSVLITIVNKVVLTSYGFPSFQFFGFAQMVFVAAIILALKSFGVLALMPMTRNNVTKILPLTFFYVANLLTGLGGTKELSLPMFVVLRRFGIVFTMILEWAVLGVAVTAHTMVCCVLMIGGALFAAWNDFGFHLFSYGLVMSNNVATAANNVVMRMKILSNDVDKNSIVFYNCLFGAAPLFLLGLLTGDFEPVFRFDKWSDPLFVAHFACSCCLAYALLFSAAWCTEANSALMTCIIGVLKNSVVTFVGMVIGGDYIFNIANFAGILISLSGAILYAVNELAIKKSKPAPIISNSVNQDPGFSA